MKKPERTAEAHGIRTASDKAVACSDLLHGKIVNADCLNVLPGMSDESIALVITSPPYFNAREYSNWNTYAEYLEWCEALAQPRLAHLNRCRWSHEQAIRDLEREIETLEETMGNGASGGTAWMRHNEKAHL